MLFIIAAERCGIQSVQSVIKQVTIFISHSGQPVVPYPDNRTVNDRKKSVRFQHLTNNIPLHSSSLWKGALSYTRRNFRIFLTTCCCSIWILMNSFSVL